MIEQLYGYRNQIPQEISDNAEFEKLKDYRNFLNGWKNQKAKKHDEILKEVEKQINIWELKNKKEIQEKKEEIDKNVEIVGKARKNEEKYKKFIPDDGNISDAKNIVLAYSEKNKDINVDVDTTKVAKYLNYKKFRMAEKRIKREMEEEKAEQEKIKKEKEKIKKEEKGKEMKGKKLEEIEESQEEGIEIIGETHLKNAGHKNEIDVLKHVYDFEPMELTMFGSNRQGGFDKNKLLANLNRITKNIAKKRNFYLQTAVELVKLFAFKFCFFGTRIKEDNYITTETIDGKVVQYHALLLAEDMGFKQTGIATQSNQFTPTRLARLFCDSALAFARRRDDFAPGLYDQCSTEGLSKEKHFLMYMYTAEALHCSDEEKKIFLKFCQKFDSILIQAKLATKDSSLERGFVARAYWVFYGRKYSDYYNEQKKKKEETKEEAELFI
jgi:hypothetical protein